MKSSLVGPVPHHPFRFGVNVYEAATREEWIGKAQRIEALGYDCFFVADHVMTFPPIAGMMAAAAATTTLRIGSNVMGNDFRHPLVLCRELAAVDLLSNGRLVFGLGTGFYRLDYDQFGIPFAPPGVRVSRLEEAIQLIKAAFRDTSFTFEGHYYSVRDFSLTPRPLQAPHPPLLLGGGSPRILALAAREADIVSLNIRTTRDGGFDTNSVSPAATAEKIAWVKAAAGERFAELELSLLCNDVVVTDDREGKAHQLSEAWQGAGVSFSAEQILAAPPTLIGTVDEIVEDVQHLRDQYGFSFIVIADSAVEAFSPVVARLSGK